MKRIIISSILLVSALFVGCDKDMTAVEEPTTGLEVKLAAVGSRAENLSYESLYLSLYYGDTTYDQTDVKWTYSSGLWSPEKTMLWKDSETSLSLFVYSPATTASYMDNVTFAAKADQSSSVNFAASEFYGYKGEISGATLATYVSSGISLTLDRKMAMLAFTFADQDLDIAEVKVNGVYLSIGYLVSTAGAFAINTLTDGCIAYNDYGTYKLIVAPATLSKDDFSVVAKTSTGNTFTYDFSSDITLTSGQTKPVTLSAQQ